jgi:hypothetical protein
MQSITFDGRAFSKAHHIRLPKPSPWPRPYVLRTQAIPPSRDIVPKIAVGGIVAAPPRQQCAQPQQGDFACHLGGGHRLFIDIDQDSTGFARF